MKNNWEKKKIGEVCNLCQGLAINIKTKHYLVEKSDLPLLRIKDLKNNTVEQYVDPINYPKSCLVNDKDLIYTRTGQIGLVFTGKFGILHNNSFKIVPNKSLLKEYLFWFLQSDEFKNKIIKLSSRTAQPDITHKIFKEQIIFVPPLSEQKQIVAILDEAFEGCDRAIRNTEKNLASARELFESYLNAIFTQKGDEWEEKKLEDICSITSKLVDPRQSDFLDLPHIVAGNIIPLTGGIIEVKTAREEELKSGKFLFDETMVLYSKIRPYLMKACRPDFSGLCSADVYPLLPNDGQLDRDFLFHLLMSRNFTDYAISGSDRAGMPKVNRDHLFRYSIWIPNLLEQIKIVQKIDEIARETQRLETIYRQKLAALKELKQSILQKAFTGELTADKEVA